VEVSAEVRFLSIRWLLSLTLTVLCLARPSLGQDTNSQPVTEASGKSGRADSNSKIYYGNRLEVSLDAGFLPINTAFIFEPSDRNPRDYTLAPIIVSLRWHLGDIWGPWFLRGNTDFTVSGSYTVIPRGPESHYAAFMTGLRRNFVQRNWSVVPYLEGRMGCGFTDAKGPQGVRYAQGQDFTFTFTGGAGVGHNFTSRFGISAGFAYMHISNLYLSEPKVPNWGINVFGPTVGINVGLGKLR